MEMKRHVTAILMVLWLGVSGVLAGAPERLEARHTHGTGCTLSSAIAAQLALGVPLPVACASAQAYVRRATLPGLSPGGGCGPLHHFVDWYGGKNGGAD